MTSSQKTIIYCKDPFLSLHCSNPSFIFRYPNGTATYIMSHGLPEQPLIEWCQQFCKKDKVFVDIGAHFGSYALSLAPYCQTVYAFECQRETYYQLCGGVAINAYWNIYPHHVALGDKNEEKVPININSVDGGGTSLLNNNDNQPLEVDYCSMKTLDSFQLENIGFLKIDAEGYEEFILKGAVNTLKQSGYPPFLFESWADPKYIAQKESLHKFITEQLQYKIVPINNYPYMFLATH